MIMLESAVRSNKDLAALMTVERLDIAKGWAPMTFPQYISILKSCAHELDAEDGNSSRGRCSHYQSIHQSERGGGREGRGGWGGRGGHDGHGRGCGRGGRGQGDGEKDDDVKATSRLPYQVYKGLPDSFKKWMKERGNDKDKSNDGKTSAHDCLANQAETMVPSTFSVSTESTGIMGAVNRGKSTASDIWHEENIV